MHTKVMNLDLEQIVILVAGIVAFFFFWEFITYHDED